MRQKIFRENATFKDRPEIPEGMHYSVHCKAVLDKEDVDCETRENEGLIGFYGDSKTAEEIAEAHTHQVLIRFYPLYQANRYDF